MHASKRATKKTLFATGVLSVSIGAVMLAIVANAGVAARAVKPVNATPPTISGTPQEGKTLTANRGTWDNSPTDYNYFWRRCASDGGSCANISGANALTYTLKTVDVGNTLRFRVVAKNADGQTTADSAPTAVIQKATPPPTTTTTTTVTTTTTTTSAPPPAVNRRPTITILGVRFRGARVYARFRVCDDSHRNVNIIERDSKPGVLSYTRRFRTLIPPRPCAVATRTWIPAPRFRHGRYTLTLTARDAYGLTSLRSARRTFFR
jgi:hypothetical protein